MTEFSFYSHIDRTHSQSIMYYFRPYLGLRARGRIVLFMEMVEKVMLFTLQVSPLILSQAFYYRFTTELSAFSVSVFFVQRQRDFLPRKLKSFSPELDSQIFIWFEEISYGIQKSWFNSKLKFLMVNTHRA